MNERIRALRSFYGLTLKKFSERIGISLNNLSDVERGATPVQERHIRLICAAFPDVNEKWLREGTGSMFEASGRSQEIDELVKNLSLSEVCAKILHTFDKLSTTNQQIVLDFVKNAIADMIRQDAAEVAEAVVSEITSDAEKNARQYIAARLEEDLGAKSSTSGITSDAG